KPTSAEATEVALLPAPAIYKNGESVTALTDVQNETIEVDGDSDNDTSLVTDKSQPSELIDVPSKVNSNVNTDISNAINTDINTDTNRNDEAKTINEPSLRSNYQRFTSDLT